MKKLLSFCVFAALLALSGGSAHTLHCAYQSECGYEYPGPGGPIEY